MRKTIKNIMAVAIFGVLAGVGQGAVSTSYTGAPDLITDGGYPGSVVQHTFNVSGSAFAIADLSVDLVISGSTGNGSGYLGDLYVTLEKDGVTAVLLNRVGKTTAMSGGSWLDGFSGTLGLTGTDVHFAESNGGLADTSGRLTGSWAADGRLVSPSTVDENSARDNTLSAFINAGVSPIGDWKLTVADANLDNIYQMQLDSATLNITAVPEPAATAAAVAGLLAAFALLRRPQFRARLGDLVSR